MSEHFEQKNTYSKNLIEGFDTTRNFNMHDQDDWDEAFYEAIEILSLNEPLPTKAHEKEYQELLEKVVDNIGIIAVDGLSEDALIYIINKLDLTNHRVIDRLSKFASIFRDSILELYDPDDDHISLDDQTRKLVKALEDKKNNPKSNYLFINYLLGLCKNDFIDDFGSMDREMRREEIRNKIEQAVSIFSDQKIETYVVDRFEDFILTGVKDIIQKKLQLNLDNFSIREQFWFFQFIQYQTIESMEKAKQHIETYGENGVRVFLSLRNTDEKMGDLIITLGEKLPSDVAKKIFAKYAELVDLTDGVAEYVQQFHKENKDDNQENKDDHVSAAEISEKLLIRAKDVLVHSIEKSPEEILAMLDTVKADAELFKSVFIIEKKRGGIIALENIREAQFENKKSYELNDEEKRSMRALYAKNYATTQELQKKLLDSFEDALANPKSSFYLFKFKGTIKGFDRFDDIGDNKKYFGSFNIDESMQGATLGESMIEQSLNYEAKDYEILAESNAVNRIGARYIESGFIATDFIENYYGIPIFSIIRNDAEIPHKFKTKIMDSEDLKTFVTHPRDDIRVYTAPTQQDLIPYFHQIGKRYVLTRYFEDKKTNQWYAVMEQVTLDSLM